MFMKELSFPQTAPTDDAFFNRNWAGVCRGRWAGPGLLAGWDVGFWIAGAGVGLLLLLIGKLWTWHSSVKTRKKGGRRGRCPLPLRCLSQFLSERKERLLRMLRFFAYLSMMERPCIYSGCSTSWMVIRSPPHWMEYFLFHSVSDLFQDMERIVYLR